MNPDEVTRHLVEARLAGAVSTTPANTRSKIAGLFAGDPRCTFGLSLCADATDATIADALLASAGCALGDDAEPGFIDPRLSLEGIHRHGDALQRLLRTGGANVLIATGHPAGLLEHYSELARTLEAAGNTVLRPLDGGPAVGTGFELEPESSVRFVAGVGCVYRKPGSLVHSHLAHYMEAMLDHLHEAGTRVDLVIGDHGMAGAAMERGLETLAIADVNDIPLLLAAHAGSRHVLVIDDNRPAHFFQPVTRTILARASRDV